MQKETSLVKNSLENSHEEEFVEKGLKIEKYIIFFQVRVIEALFLSS